jgi:hypothetical protein
VALKLFIFIWYVSCLELEEDNTEIYGDTILRDSQLYEVQVTAVNASILSRTVSQTHTIYNIGVRRFAECQTLSSVCSNIL